MGKIKSMELSGTVSHLVATYEGEDGTEYQIVLCESFDANADFRWREVVNIQKDDEDIEDDPLLQEAVKNALLNQEAEEENRQSFAISVDREDLPLLHQLIEQFQESKFSTVEEAFEAGVFGQIQEQLHA